MITVSSLQDPQLPQLYAAGGVGVLPTDTIYGLTASAHNPQAASRLYGLKSREHKPGTVIAASVEQLRRLGVAEQYLAQVAHLWPNPLSIELPLDDSLAYLHQGTGHGAFRVVADAPLRALLEQTGPLLTTSANHPGQPPAANMAEARIYFTDKVDFYVDGGNRSDRPASTVARLRADGTFEIKRPGAVAITEKGEVI
jgi:tRNA threonylcarbamoyl adenosine modification protein (Sua5/YciO/YrdC/YwlC family)